MQTALVLPARRLLPADAPWATALLASACTDHPLLNYCCPGPQAAGQRVWLLEGLLRFSLRYGRVYTNAEGSALALWMGPGHKMANAWQLMRTGLVPAVLWRLGWAGGVRLNEVLQAGRWLRHQSVGTAPYHFLLGLAVRSTERGLGHGRRLLHATLLAGQAAQGLCYLATQVPEQLPFFQRAGFRLTGQCPTHPGLDSPTTWGLVRDGRQQ